MPRSFENSTYTDRDKYEANRKREREAEKKRINDYIDSFIEPSLFCGSEEDIEFHHVNALEKDVNVRRLHSIKAIREEAPKCWCLCKKCHKALHQRLCDPLPDTYDIRISVP